MRLVVIGALIATGVGAAAVAGAAGGGATFGSALAASFTSPAAFGATLKAGLFGATGAAGTTAGLFGAGGVGATALAGPGLTTALGGTPVALGSASGVTAAGANLTGGALFGGSITTPIAPAASPTIIGTTTGTTAAGKSVTGTVSVSSVPTAATTSVGGAAPKTFMSKLGKWSVDAVSAGGKMVVGGLMMNTLMGDREEEEYYRSGSGRATSFSTNTRKMVDVGQYVERYSSSSRSDLSGIYGTMLNNLAYGNGSLDYARNTQVALMSGINVAPIQYT